MTAAGTTNVLLTTRDLAARWRCGVQWLANERSAGRGVPYVKLGRAVRYRLADVEQCEADATVATVAA